MADTAQKQAKGLTTVLTIAVPVFTVLACTSNLPATWFVSGALLVLSLWSLWSIP